MTQVSKEDFTRRIPVEDLCYFPFKSVGRSSIEVYGYSDPPLKKRYRLDQHVSRVGLCAMGGVRYSYEPSEPRIRLSCRGGGGRDIEDKSPTPARVDCISRQFPIHRAKDSGKENC